MKYQTIFAEKMKNKKSQYLLPVAVIIGILKVNYGYVIILFLDPDDTKIPIQARR